MSYKTPAKTPANGSSPRGEGYVPGMLDNIQSEDDFASLLNVPKKSIQLIVPINDKPCGAKQVCPFVAIAGNSGCCPIHRQTWYPKKGKRGEKMYGPSFLRHANPGRVCDCDQPSCSQAGYFPSQGALPIPKPARDVILRTGRLFSEAKLKKFTANPDERIFLYPWHFFRNHLIVKDNNWMFDYKKKEGKLYYDKEHKEFTFPPPNNNVCSFIDEELLQKRCPRDRWTTSDMPIWLMNMLAIDDELRPDESESPRKVQEEKDASPKAMQLKVEMYQARAHCLKEQLDEKEKTSGDILTAANARHKKEKMELKENHDAALSEMKKKYDAALSEMKQKYEVKLKAKDDYIDDAKAQIIEQQQTIARLNQLITELEDDVQAQAELLKQLRESGGRPLKFKDLFEGGMLSGNVKNFTFFNTAKQNDLFLEVLNYVDGSPGSYPEGDGLCENLRRYQDVGWDERSGKKDPPSMDMDSPEYKVYLAKKKAARKNSDRTWKDDFLAFSIYLRSGATQEFVACLCGISKSRMSDILYEWAQVLDDGLQQWFPTPTRSQVLRAYPDRFIEADGHAMCFLLLDVVEIFAQKSSNPNVASTTYSDYKKNPTVKFLAGSGTVGETAAKFVPDGNGGKGSDVMMTDDTNILAVVPFGNTCKTDKGFIVDNIASREGVRIDRPQKRKRYQKQQSAIDTAQTQKIGNTRIIIENVNGGVKSDVRYLNALIPCHQFGIISQIVRIGFLLQNFKKPLIQNNNPDSKLDASAKGVPCRAEVRWHGATCAGLSDVRGSIYKWGLNCEIERHGKLHKMEEHRDKSMVEISEMVLSERWDLKKREELYALDGREYEGDKFRQDLYEKHGVN